MDIKKLAVISVVALGALACSRSKPAETSQSGVAKQPTQMAVVPANQKFRVVMKDSLSSETAQPGQKFTAILAEQLWSGDGRVVAEPGSELSGHVVAVQSGSEPRLAIMFDSIATKGGLAMFDGRVTDALNAPFAFATSRQPNEADADLVARPSAAAMGGGPASEDADVNKRVVFIPDNAELELVLSVPLSIALPR